MAGCSSTGPIPVGYEGVDALTWFQTSEEARQIQRSVFLAATTALEEALRNPAWRALDQPAAVVDLPAAVIVDVDETVLDNSPFEVALLAKGETFGAQAWAQWVNRAEARAIPGAVDFLKLAAERGVRVFYVTNRDAKFEDATRSNLEREGFPLDDSHDVLLMRGERPEWTSDKESRRRVVAAEHRVLLLLGDDLNDFVSGAAEGTLASRRQLADASDRFGVSWFVLPNPLYGSWKRAIDAAPDAPASLVERRLRVLRQPN